MAKDLLPTLQRLEPLAHFQVSIASGELLRGRKTRRKSWKRLEKCLTGGHFGQTQDDEELTGYDPTVAPEHAGYATIYQHLEVVEDNKFRSVEVSTAPIEEGEVGRHIRWVNLQVSVKYVQARYDELIHCARCKGDTTEPVEVTLQFLLLTHTGHVLVILGQCLTTIVADR